MLEPEIDPQVAETFLCYFVSTILLAFIVAMLLGCAARQASEKIPAKIPATIPDCPGAPAIEAKKDCYFARGTDGTLEERCPGKTWIYKCGPELDANGRPTVKR